MENNEKDKENNKINKIVCLEKEGLKEDFTENFTGKISIDERIATVYNREQCMICCKDSFFDGICLTSEFFSEEELLQFGQAVSDAGKNVYLALPHVFRTNLNLEKVCVSSIWNGIYAYTINEAEFLHELKGRTAKIIAAASLYHWNSSAVSETAALYPEMTVREIPIELSAGEVMRCWNTVMRSV